MAVSLEDVYDAFGFGEVSPDAIQRLPRLRLPPLDTPPRPATSSSSATPPTTPRASSPDRSRKDLLPTPLTRSSFLWAPSDPLYASVNGDDLLPDLAIGRLNADSLAEAQAAVQKILDFENASAHPRRQGRPRRRQPRPRRRGLRGQPQRHRLPPHLPARREDLPHPARRRHQGRRPRRLRPGPSLVSYVGHGSQGLWASERIFSHPRRRPPPAPAPPAPRPHHDLLQRLLHLPLVQRPRRATSPSPPTRAPSPPSPPRGSPSTTPPTSTTAPSSPSSSRDTTRGSATSSSPPRPTTPRPAPSPSSSPSTTSSVTRH